MNYILEALIGDYSEVNVDGLCEILEIHFERDYYSRPHCIRRVTT